VPVGLRAPPFGEDDGSPCRAFYETEALREGWSVRQLDRQIGSQLYERLSLSRDKAALLKKAADSQPGDQITPEEAIRDPFVLEFLDIRTLLAELVNFNTRRASARAMHYRLRVSRMPYRPSVETSSGSASVNPDDGNGSAVL
jgi:hypothetical protein